MEHRFRHDRFSRVDIVDCTTEPRFPRRCPIEDRLTARETFTAKRSADVPREIPGIRDWWDFGKANKFEAGPGCKDQAAARAASLIDTLCPCRPNCSCARNREIHAGPCQRGPASGARFEDSKAARRPLLPR